MTGTLFILLFALLLDRAVGDPPKLWRAMPHPVVLFGRAIGVMDRLFNGKRLTADTKRFNGAVGIVVLLVASAFVAYVLGELLGRLRILGDVLEIVIVAILLAQKSLHDHVRAVSRGLKHGGIE